MQQRRQRAGDPGGLGLADQRAEQRDPQREAVEPLLQPGAAGEAASEEQQPPHCQQHRPPEAGHPVAGGDHHPRGQREVLTEGQEQRLELGDHERHQHEDGGDAHQQQEGGVDEGADHLPPQAGGLGEVGGKVLQDFHQAAALLAGVHEAHVDGVEDAGVLLQGLGEGGGPDGEAALDLADHPLEVAAAGLVADRLEGLDDREAGLQERRELAGEHGEVGGAGAAEQAGEAVAEREATPGLGLDGEGVVAELLDPGEDLAGVGGEEAAADTVAGAPEGGVVEAESHGAFAFGEGEREDPRTAEVEANFG